MFIHLRNHSAYSLAEGAIKIKDFPKLCHQFHMPAVGICDSFNLFGALEFSTTCMDQAVQPIIGCQLNLSYKSSLTTQSQHIVLFAQNEKGYQNLLKLVSQSYLSVPIGEKPFITLAQLSCYSHHLIALTAGLHGTLGQLLLLHYQDQAVHFLKTLHDLFPQSLYIELQRHHLLEEEEIEEPLIHLAYDFNIPLVATNDVFFPTEDLYEAHDALLCIAEGTYINEPNRRRVTPHHYFKSHEEMAELFQDLPEALYNSFIIAQRCSFAPLAKPPIFPLFPTTSDLNETEELRQQAKEGLEQRLVNVKEPDQRYEDRLLYELSIIEKMGFSGYFLIVADFIKWARSQGIPVGPGRGSGAGSLVAWALTITDMDPIYFGLIFERFLNPERISMPDFDIDFCQDRRDEVIHYVVQKYGIDRVAHIITFGKLQARAVIRDVGRVLQIPYSQVDKICKLIPNNPAHPTSLEQALILEPTLEQARQEDPTISKLIDIGIKLEGLYRHASTHAAGVVISDRPLDELIPLYRDEKSNLPVTQFSMKYVEMAGLLKFDFLGLKTLTIIEKCAEMIRLKGVSFDISKIPLNDPKTFELLCRVDVVGVFQVESAGMRDVLRKLKPDRFEDLVALVALYRPGPMDDIPRYLACKHGVEPVTYLHPLLEPILAPTYGVMVYQEQVMQIAQIMSGYSLGEADLLRRAMGKKIKSEMDVQRARFIEGATNNNVSPSIASQVFDAMAKFAGYGFNKSHAAPYALLVYQTAYLKANYPLEFFASSMTYERGDTDKLNNFRQDMIRLGFTLLPPDINHSFVTFVVENKTVRYALAAIKNVGEQAMKSVVEERKRQGPFKDMADFARRIDPRLVNKRQLESLIAAGVFDSINQNRAELYSSIETILRYSQNTQEEKKTKQTTLFQVIETKPILTSNQDWSPLQRLQKEFEALGFYFTSHPLELYGKTLNKLGVSESYTITEKKDGTVLKLAGVILVKQERTSKSGQKFAFLQCSDLTGVFEVVVFSDLFSKTRNLLVPGTPLFITALLRHDGEGYRLTTQHIEKLDQVMQDTTKMLKICIGERVCPRTLYQVLTDAGPGTTYVRFEIILDDLPIIEIDLPTSYNITADSRSRLMAIPGVLGIKDIFNFN
ncbi:MAG: DNA polymerase III subunit alpha [Proteobacteria bacterium]|nr:DNA polymerase III subunit alpha [Pseudomonadota bacterium]